MFALEMRAQSQSHLLSFLRPQILSHFLFGGSNPLKENPSYLLRNCQWSPSRLAWDCSLHDSSPKEVPRYQMKTWDKLGWLSLAYCCLFSIIVSVYTLVVIKSLKLSELLILLIQWLPMIPCLPSSLSMQLAWQALSPTCTKSFTFQHCLIQVNSQA